MSRRPGIHGLQAVEDVKARGTMWEAEDNSGYYTEEHSVLQAALDGTSRKAARQWRGLRERPPGRDGAVGGP
jgi:hypothetical protein